MNDSTAFNVIFREIQRLGRPWTVGPISVILALLLGLLVYSYLVHSELVRPVAPGLVPERGTVISLTIVAAALGASLILIYVATFTTEVRGDGLYLQYFPFHLSFRKIPFNNIMAFEVVTYRPIRDYGGWGIRYGCGGKAYNASGNRGVQLKLVGAKKLLIGSQKAEELAAALKSKMTREKPW